MKLELSTKEILAILQESTDELRYEDQFNGCEVYSSKFWKSQDEIDAYFKRAVKKLKKSIKHKSINDMY